RSKIVKNTGGGIVVDGGGMLVLENSFVGGKVFDAAAVNVQNGTATILYSTLGGGGFYVSPALECVEAQTTVSARNSLIVARQAESEFACDDAVLTNNALEIDESNNTSIGSFPMTPPQTGFSTTPVETSTLPTP